MGDARWDEVQCPRSHWLHPRSSRFIHQDQGTFSIDGRVVLGAVALLVKMSVSHEVFRIHMTRFDHGCSPEQSALGALWHRTPGLDTVHNGTWIHTAQGLLVCINTLQFSERLHTFTDCCRG